METYKIHVKCNNCGSATVLPQQMIEIPKGITIEEALNNKPCQNCGCKTLRESKGY